MSECYAKIENPALRQFIIDYIDERIAEHKAIDPEHVPDVHTVALAYEIKGDTLVYIINKTSPGTIIGFAEWPMLVTKVDGIYVACYDKRFKEIQMTVEGIVTSFKDGYPALIPDYQNYLKRKRTHPDNDNYHNAAFNSFIYEGDYWIVKFVNDKLVSKTVISGIHGFQEYIEY